MKRYGAFVSSSLLLHQRLLQLLEQPLVRSLVSKPPLAAANQCLGLGHARVVELPTQRYGDGVLLRVRRVALKQIIGPYCDRDPLTLVDFDDGESLDLHH